MINNVDALEILKIGVIGLGFLLALLAFFLLRNEQNKAQARPPILSVVKLFMAFSLVLCLIGLFAELFPEANSSKQRVASLEKENERLKVISEHLEKTCDYIRTSNWLDRSDEARKSLSQWCN